MKILVVDDSAVMRRIIRSELTAGGYAVSEAENGFVALSMAAAIKPDLITLDVDMPKFNGFMTCEKLAHQSYTRHFTHKPDGRIPIVFITASDSIDKREKGFELGAADFITKPFPPGVVLNAVNTILKPNLIFMGLTALAVDDNTTARRITSEILRQEGLTVLECADGLEALEVLQEGSRQIDIVVTDVEMPNMDGQTLCRKIRGDLALSDLPVIFLTGVSDRSNLIKLFQIGATDYLIKPFMKEEFVARLNAHLKQSMLTRHLRENIQSLEQANREIKLLSITDPLTQCFNRGYMVEHLNRELRRHRRHERPFSLILCDIDHFKKVNDTYGHQAGDQVLVAFAGIIRNTMRQDIDWIARYGGEEFLIACPETDIQAVEIFGERLRVAVEQAKITTRADELSITASFGATGFDAGTPDADIVLENLINRADSLLYDAKHKGRNTVQVAPLS